MSCLRAYLADSPHNGCRFMFPTFSRSYTFLPPEIQPSTYQREDYIPHWVERLGDGRIWEWRDLKRMK